MSTQNIQDIRRDYMLQSLGEKDLIPDAIQLFSKWFDEAVNAEIPDVNAMTLSTCGLDGQPHGRIVLLKGLENGGFVFYTNYESAKGKQIAENSKVGLCFYWTELERQVSIAGRAKKLPAEISEAYFKSRPYESRIGAWSSHQSRKVQSRAQLEAQYKDMLEEYPDKDNVPLPPFWGGYVIIPSRLEFWQGRESRMHDRFEYLKSDGEWIINRLSP
jgi:pyridoxamine 5'-phosphate oxidase